MAEEKIGNDRNNLTIRSLDSDMARRDLSSYRQYGAHEDAVRRFFEGHDTSSVRFQSWYRMDYWNEDALLGYLKDPDLTVQLANACGPCDDCGGNGCPYDSGNVEPVALQDFLREEAGIPEGAKLGAEVDEEEHTVTFFIADHAHDLSDVPKAQLVMLDAAGVCLGELERHLMAGDVIFHG